MATSFYDVDRSLAIARENERRKREEEIAQANAQEQEALRQQHQQEQQRSLRDYTPVTQDFRPYNANPIVKDRGFLDNVGAGVGSSLRSLASSGYSAAGGAAEAMGADGVADWAHGKSDEWAKSAAEHAPRVQRLSDIGSFGDAVDYVGGQVGNVAGSAPIIGAGLVAGHLTKNKGLATRIMAPTLAGTAASLPTEYGGMVQQYKHENNGAAIDDATNLRMLGAGAGSAALQSIVPAGVGATVARGSAMRGLRDAAKRPVVGSLLGHTVKGMAKDSAEEFVINPAAEIFKSKVMNPDKPIDWNEMLEVGVGGAIGGAAMGGVQGPASYAHAKADQLAFDAKAGGKKAKEYYGAVTDAGASVVERYGPKAMETVDGLEARASELYKNKGEPITESLAKDAKTRKEQVMSWYQDMRDSPDTPAAVKEWLGKSLEAAKNNPLSKKFISSLTAAKEYVEGLVNRPNQQPASAMDRVDTLFLSDANTIDADVTKVIDGENIATDEQTLHEIATTEDIDELIRMKDEMEANESNAAIAKADIWASELLQRQDVNPEERALITGFINNQGRSVETAQKIAAIKKRTIDMDDLFSDAVFLEDAVNELPQTDMDADGVKYSLDYGGTNNRVREVLGEFLSSRHKFLFDENNPSSKKLMNSLTYSIRRVVEASEKGVALPNDALATLRGILKEDTIKVLSAARRSIKGFDPNDPETEFFLGVINGMDTVINNQMNLEKVISDNIHPNKRKLLSPKALTNMTDTLVAWARGELADSSKPNISSHIDAQVKQAVLEAVGNDENKKDNIFRAVEDAVTRQDKLHSPMADIATSSENYYQRDMEASRGQIEADTEDGYQSYTPEGLDPNTDEALAARRLNRLDEELIWTGKKRDKGEILNYQGSWEHRETAGKGLLHSTMDDIRGTDGVIPESVKFVDFTSTNARVLAGLRNSEVYKKLKAKAEAAAKTNGTKFDLEFFEEHELVNKNYGAIMYKKQGDHDNFKMHFREKGTFFVNDAVEAQKFLQKELIAAREMYGFSRVEFVKFKDAADVVKQTQQYQAMIEGMSKKEVAKLDNQLRDGGFGVIRIRKDTIAEQVSPNDISAMKLETRKYADSPSRIEFLDPNGKPVIFDAVKMTKVMMDKDKTPYTDADEKHGRIYRMGRAFSAAMAELSRMYPGKMESVKSVLDRDPNFDLSKYRVIDWGVDDDGAPVPHVVLEDSKPLITEKTVLGTFNQNQITLESLTNYGYKQSDYSKAKLDADEGVLVKQKGKDESVLRTTGEFYDSEAFDTFTENQLHERLTKLDNQIDEFEQTKGLVGIQTEDTPDNIANSYNYDMTPAEFEEFKSMVHNASDLELARLNYQLPSIIEFPSKKVESEDGLGLVGVIHIPADKRRQIINAVIAHQQKAIDNYSRLDYREKEALARLVDEYTRVEDELDKQQREAKKVKVLDDDGRQELPYDAPVALHELVKGKDNAPKNVVDMHGVPIYYQSFDPTPIRRSAVVKDVQNFIAKTGKLGFEPMINNLAVGNAGQFGLAKKIDAIARNIAQLDNEEGTNPRTYTERYGKDKGTKKTIKITDQALAKKIPNDYIKSSGERAGVDVERNINYLYTKLMAKSKHPKKGFVVNQSPLLQKPFVALKDRKVIDPNQVFDRLRQRKRLMRKYKLSEARVVTMAKEYMLYESQGALENTGIDSLDKYVAHQMELYNPSAKQEAASEVAASEAPKQPQAHQASTDVEKKRASFLERAAKDSPELIQELSTTDNVKGLKRAIADLTKVGGKVQLNEHQQKTLDTMQSRLEQLTTTDPSAAYAMGTKKYSYERAYVAPDNEGGITPDRDVAFTPTGIKAGKWAMKSVHDNDNPTRNSEGAIKVAEMHPVLQMAIGSTKNAFVELTANTSDRHLKNRNHREITPEVIAKLDDALKNPRAILKNYQDDKGIVVVTDIRADGRPILVALRESLSLEKPNIPDADKKVVLDIVSMYKWEESLHKMQQALQHVDRSGESEVIYLRDNEIQALGGLSFDVYSIPPTKRGGQALEGLPFGVGSTSPTKSGVQNPSDRSPISRSRNKSVPEKPTKINVLSNEALGRYKLQKNDWSNATKEVSIPQGKINWNEHFSKESATVTDGANKFPRQEIESFFDKVLKDSVDLDFPELAHSGEHIRREAQKSLIRISVHASDPHGVKYHEALHEFFHQLRGMGMHKVQQVLFKASNAPWIRKQLNDHFKDQPEVLKQIKESAEERVAFMYQLHERGQIKLTERPQKIFERIKNAVMRALGIWTNDERALYIMNYFSSGEYATSGMGKPNAVQEALLNSGRNKAVDYVTDLAKPMTKLAASLYVMGGDRLRNSNIPALAKLVDKVKLELTAEGDDIGYLPASRIKRTEYMNKLVGELDSILSKVPEDQQEQHQADVIKYLQQGKSADFRPSIKVIEATDAIRSHLKDVRDYMIDSGVDVGYLGKDYFPRVWDPYTISSNLDAFKEMLTRNNIKDVDGIVQSLTQSNGNEFGEVRLRPGMQHAKPRVLKDISGIDAEPFLKKDLMSILDGYTSQATRRAEYAKRLGDDSSGLEAILKEAVEEGATPEQIREAHTFLEGVGGTLGDDMNPKLRRIFGNMVVYQNIRLLPLAIFSQAVDPMGIMVRGGTLKDSMKAYWRAIKEVKTGLKGLDSKDVATKAAQDLGVIERAVLTSSIGAAYTQGMVGDKAQKLNDTLFKFNLMEQANKSVRVAATEAALRFIARHANGESEHSERFLRELGLEAKDIQFMGDGTTVAYNESHGITKAQAAKIRHAVNRWVDGAVLRPDAVDKPIWMNDPRYMLVAHMKPFVFSFVKTYTERMKHEASNGNYKPAAALATFVPIMIAADMLKGMIMNGGELPDYQKNWGFSDWTVHGVERAGLLGVGQFGKDARDYGITALSGPAIEQLVDGIGVIDGGKDAGKFVMRSMPANALYRNIPDYFEDSPTPASNQPLFENRA